MEYFAFFVKVFVGVLYGLFFIFVGVNSYEILDWFEEKLGETKGILVYITFVSLLIAFFFTLVKFLVEG